MAAVLINSREISILSIGTEEIKQVTSFKTGTDGNSITKDTGGLYVCFCDKIVFYTYTGEVDRSRCLIPSEKSKKAYNFRHIARSSDQKYIYVTDLNHGILQFDKCGVLLWTLSGLRINTPTAMCIDQKDTIYVTDTDNCAFKIIRNTDNISFMIEPIQDIEQATSLCFEKTHNRLVVGQWCSDYIHVFSVL
jgi:6-phosphogluconolactonase (cycloisomerase 2 family)